MRNRFLAHEVYEEWFEGSMSRKQWEKIVTGSQGMSLFRTLMFQRLVPNLRAIGLLTPRMYKHYSEAGLMKFAGGRDATQLRTEDMFLSGDLMHVA
jgi:hypothetical protein